MNKLTSIFIQTLLILVIGIGIGFLVNATSSDPLPLVREEVTQQEIEERWETAAAEEVFQHFEEGTAIIIDARDPNEYDAGHIPGSINLPETGFLEAFQEYGESLPREIPLIVYCQGGDCDQSHAVLEQLESFGFEELILYQEGWNGWKEKGYPTEP